MTTEEYLTVKEVAEILKRTGYTVRVRYIKPGLLKATQLQKNGEWLIKRSDLEEFIRGEGN